MFRNYGSYIGPFNRKSTNEDLEGEPDVYASPGCKGQVAPPTTEDTVSALRAENEFLRQILYHKSTHSEERDYQRWLRFAKGVSTSNVASTVSSLQQSGIHCAQHNIKLQPQFVFRLTYAIIERVVGTAECRWAEKPAGLSKLKWLWQNNLLFVVPFVIHIMEMLLNEMLKAHPLATKDVIKALDVSMSKKSRNKQKP